MSDNKCLSVANFIIALLSFCMLLLLFYLEWVSKPEIIIENVSLSCPEYFGSKDTEIIKIGLKLRNRGSNDWCIPAGCSLVFEPKGNGSRIFKLKGFFDEDDVNEFLKPNAAKTLKFEVNDSMIRRAEGMHFSDMECIYNVKFRMETLYSTLLRRDHSLIIEKEVSFEWD